MRGREVDRVFSKTAKGRDEIARRSAGLNARQRQVLILIDGVKPLGALQTTLPGNDFIGTIAMLQALGLIATGEAAAPPVQAAATAIARGGPVLSTDPAQLAALKQLLADTSRTYLGLLSSDICRRIDAAGDAAQLLSVLGQWHMALCQSRHGGAYARAHLRQIEAGFYGGPVPSSGVVLDLVF